MKPIEFEWMTARLAEHQDEYQTLPVYHDRAEYVSCWRFTLWERIRVLFGAKMWLRQLHCGRLLQPQLPQVLSPMREIMRANDAAAIAREMT